jgi:FemAB-related protein (PEP-CTERM system-associated)
VNALAPIGTVGVRAADLDEPGECTRLDAFVREHEDGTISHRPQWSRAVRSGAGQRGHYLVAERGGALLGLLPLIEVRSPLFGNALVSVGFATCGGVLVRDQAAVAPLADAAWTLALQLGCRTAELRGGVIPDGWHRRTGIYSSFDRALPADADSLLASIPKRQRAEIRRAIGNGLEVSSGRDSRHLEAHFRAYGESVRNLGTPVFPRRLFEASLEAFGDDSDIVIVWKDGRPLASMLNFYFKRTCQPFWGGGTAEARRWKANDLIYYEVLRRAIERGCTRADFGRSKVGTGAWLRKRIWDFDETPLVYATRTADGAAPRELNPLRAKYRLQVAAWQKVPLWVANRLGPMISRGMG